MPELPDVAGFKMYLDATSLHQAIASTRCFDERFIKDVSRQKLQQRLKGATLEKSHRRGKWLLVELSTGGYLVFHFGMTGELNYGSGELPKHTRLALYFDNDRRLAVLSQRMIGRASYTDDMDQWARQQELGPDALEVNVETFLERMQGRRGTIKSALMNQAIITGVGNVYSDEILFQTGLHPESQVKRLDEATFRAVYKAMRRILSIEAKKGGNGRKAPEKWLLGNRNPDSPCPGCGGRLKSQTVGGRTAWFCPSCQSKP